MIWIGPLQLQLDISLAGHHAVWEATTCKHDYVPHFALAKKEKAMFSLKESVSVLIALIIFDVFPFCQPLVLGHFAWACPVSLLEQKEPNFGHDFCDGSWAKWPSEFSEMAEGTRFQDDPRHFLERFGWVLDPEESEERTWMSSPRMNMDEQPLNPSCHQGIPFV